MRVKITIEIERNGYTATETVEYIDRTPADITAEMAGQLQRLQAACNLRDRLRYEADDAMAAGPINHLSDEADAQVVIDKTRCRRGRKRRNVPPEKGHRGRRRAGRCDRPAERR